MKVLCSGSRTALQKTFILGDGQKFRYAFTEQTVMALEMVKQCLKIIPAVLGAPQKYLWSSYDAEADVLYINFKKPSHATESELTENDIIIRYEGEEIIGLTVLHASKR